MPLARLAARSLFAGVFIVGGANVVKNAGAMSGLTNDLLDSLPGPLANVVPDVPAETLTKVHGATMVAAGTTLALGIAPRLSSLVLAAQLVPVTLTGHAYWKHEGDEKANQKIHFQKNLALAGGLLVSALGGPKKHKK